MIKMAVNRKGGLYVHGTKLPPMFRERVLDLYHENISQRQIAQLTRTSLHFVQNVIRDYNVTNSSLQPPKSACPRQKMTGDVVDFIEMEKLLKPSTYSSEIQERMVLDGVVHPLDVPSKASITKCIRLDLLMSHKKLSVTPLESTTANNVALKDTYLDQVSELNPATLHFFDESSVVKTTANRHFGSSYVGQAAFEFQKYASNATYTLNLLHSMQGVDYINIIDGPSNGNAMLLFFEEAVELQNNDGSAILERGDTVIMDNCGFHHGHFVEPLLTDMLAEYGLRLLFQPPYPPHLNTCELCFHQIKCFLKRNQLLAQQQTEIAILDACREITVETSSAYFRHCGYLQ